MPKTLDPVGKYNLYNFLRGKKIADVNLYAYFDWVVLEDILFDDGSKVELSGNADVSIIECIMDSDGQCIDLPEVMDLEQV
jgi:hypothetical protein